MKPALPIFAVGVKANVFIKMKTVCGIIKTVTHVMDATKLKEGENHMNILVGERNQGKTTHLIQMSVEGKGTALAEWGSSSGLRLRRKAADAKMV